MDNFILSVDAMRDMEAIDAYGFLHFGGAQTDAYIADLKTVLTLLARYPEMGRLDDKFVPPVHRFEHGSHIVLYDTCADHIFIVRVLHKAMDVGSHLVMER